MKKLIHTLLAVAAALCAAACGSDGGTTEPVGPTAALAASPAEFAFTADGGTKNISITAPGAWSIVWDSAGDSGAGWCYALQSTGGKGTTSTGIHADANDGAARSARLILRSAGCDDVTITVTQEAAAYDPTLVEAEPDEWDGVRRGETVYQLLVYSFADSDGDGVGDFRGIIDKMDYIDRMGAAAIWLSPIHPADSYHGYDVTDYTAVNPLYGTMADFEALVAEAHRRGIKVYLDYVINHTGKGHPWYVDAYSSTESEHRDWYIFSQNPDADVAAGKFPMINPGKVEGSWVNVPVTSGGTETRRYKFTLDWSSASAPKLTVVETSEPVSAVNTDTSVQRFLYFGTPAQTLRFHSKGGSLYELVADYSSPWGFLIRTSDTSWDGGTKYGAPSSAAKLTLGVPFTLNNTTAADILFADMDVWQVYSACYTEWMPDLNYGAVSSFRESGPYKAILESVEGWLDKGVDGLRLDMVKHIYSDPDGSENPAFWTGFYEDVNSYYRSKGRTDDIYMVGEVLSGVGQVANYANALPSCFDFEFWGWGGETKLSYAVKNSVGRYIAKDLLDIQSTLLARNGRYIDATVLSNHDMDRAASTLGGSVDRCRMAGVVLQTLTGRPFIYYGEELAYTGRKDKGDEYVRAPMLWGDGYTTSYTDKVSPEYATMPTVEDMEADDSSILNAYRRFCNLRNIYPAMTEKGSMTPCTSIYEGSGSKLDAIGAWYRESDGERLLVLHNLKSSALEFTVADDVDKAVAVMGAVRFARSETAAGGKVTMPAYSSVVFKLK
ncbi:MAG: alpha-amylase [Alistipes sp.]|nr:alpha-amylase [Alistipes sp.]